MAAQQDAGRSLLSAPGGSLSAMRLRFAVNILARMRGLLGTQGAEDILVIAPCHRIHTFGMRFALDVAYVSEQGQVLRVIRGLEPGCLPRGCPSAVAVLERRASTDAWLAPGQFVELRIREQGTGPCLERSHP